MIIGITDRQEGKCRKTRMMFRNHLAELVFQKYIDDYDLKMYPGTHIHRDMNILEDTSEQFLSWV